MGSDGEKGEGWMRRGAAIGRIIAHGLTLKITERNGGMREEMPHDGIFVFRAAMPWHQRLPLPV
eukprot:3523828-Rhodomonas_salina.1